MDPISLAKSALHRPDHSDGVPVVLELDLARGLVMQAPANPIEAFRQRQSPSMRQVRDALRKARDDDEVAGLIVHLGACPLTPAQGDELAEVLRDFARSRPVAAWTETFGELASGLVAYRVATAATEIWLQPTGGLAWTGVELDITLLRGGLEKLHITPEFGQRKEYKSAADQFAATTVTDANREMMQRIADSLVDDTVERITRSRSLDESAVRTAVDDSPLTAARAHELGLVDRLGYRDEVYADLRERWGEDGRVSLKYAHRYEPTTPFESFEAVLNRSRPTIGVVGIIGGIVTGPGRPAAPMGGSQAGADTVCAHLREAGRDDSIKAVVLRVDSPGGSYIASDMIRREVGRLRDSGKPVVVSMGDVAASGGYFVAMAADAIVANPTTLTGSIGVLAGKFVTQGLVEHLGLVRESVRSGRDAGWMGSTEPFTDEQWAKLDAWLDEVYADFTGKAAHDRRMSLETLEPLARGRVWTGADAADHGLVDELGGMGRALDLAADRIGRPLSKLNVRMVPAVPWLGQLRQPESSESSPGLQQSVWTGATGGPEAILAAAARLAGIELPTGVLALPWRLTIR